VPQIDAVTIDLNSLAPRVTLNGQTTTLAAGSPVTAVHVNLGSGNDTVNVVNSSAEVDVTSSGNDVVTVNASHGSVYLEDFQGVINVQSTDGPLTVSGAFSGSAVNVGLNGSVQGITGTLTIRNPANHNTINVDDSADATARTVTVGDAGGGFSLVHGLAPADVLFAYAETNSVTVSTGTGGNTVNVQATAVATNLIGHGRDTVNVGQAGSVQGIRGALNVTNPPSFSSLNVNDSADTAARHATLGQATVNGDAHWETLSGLAPASISYYDYDVASIAMLINNSSSVAVTNDGGVYTTVNGQLR
jgi:hypothetical protein